MLVDYPLEWEEYMIRGKIRTFRAGTPKNILEKAKAFNKKIFENHGDIIFYFEDEKNED